MIRFIQPIVLLLCATTVLSSCPSNKLTYEACVRHQDCVDLISRHVCVSRDAGGILQNCTNTEEEHCVCRTDPKHLHYCSNNADCPDQMYCGQSRRSRTKFCIGCLTLFDDKYVREDGSGNTHRVFTSVDPVDTFANRCNNVTKAHPPCGQRGDLCSKTMPCDTAYSCLATAENATFACRWQSKRCQCRANGAVGPYDYTACDPAAVGSCTEEREVCAFHTKLLKNVCVSCDYARSTHYFTIPDSTKCDSLEEERKEPTHYVLGPNGRTLDQCVSDVQCADSRKCVMGVEGYRKLDWEWERFFERFRRCHKSADTLCYCIPKGNAAEIARCKTGSDCDVGESCMSMDIEIDKKQTHGALGLPGRNMCASNAFLDIMSSKLYRIVGMPSVPSSETAQGLTLDTCMYDWDCKAPRRCTHATDKYGECAGRRGCRCQPLLNPPCNATADCEAGELCVSTPGALFQPLCISEDALKKVQVRDFYPVGAPELENGMSPTPLPAGIYTGLTREPCLSVSDCVDPRECLHWSDVSNKRMCDNDRRGCICRLPFQGPDQPRIGNCTMTADCTHGEVCHAHLDGVLEPRVCISAIVFDERKKDEALAQFGKRNATPTPSASVSVSMSPLQTPSSSASASSSTSPLDTPTSSASSSPSTSTFSVPSATASASARGSASESDGGGEGEVTPTAEVSEVCVDVKLLEGMERSQLVFAKHRRASVLCDQYGSCATPGHMVTLNGRAMSMNTYCSRQTSTQRCSRRTAWVNSPRMVRGIRLDSKTDGLKMTALSARYESWLEEIVLSKIIHAGL